MPAEVIPITAARHGVWVLLEAALPGQPVHPIGVLLADPATDRGYVQLREGFDDLTDDPEVLDALAAELPARLAQTGAEAWLREAEDSWSNTLRVSERHPVLVDAFTRVLEQLFDRHVEARCVDEFRTHLPLYSLRAAAGYLSDESMPEAEDWVPAPPTHRITRDMFVARVEGASMEPLIADRSLNLFRFGIHGSRQGKVVLIERFGVVDEAARYSVKQYSSRKRTAEDGQWEHERIDFVPRNREFAAWSPDSPEEFRIVAEWVETLE